MEKEQVLSMVRERLNLKIKNLELMIADKRASNNDTKSSMGDKYETGREMLQQEINNLQPQLNEFIKSENALTFLNISPHQIIGNGSLVKTAKGLFYIAVSLGEISFNGEEIFVVSPDSPIAKAMQGKTEGENFSLNGISQRIEKIW